jgi:DNA repair photolyase
VGELNRAGIPTGILVAPLMPGINDDPRQVEEILQAAADAGATGVSGITLHLRGEVRGIFMEWLRSYRPDLVERYEELYARSAYAPRVEQERIGALVRRARSRTVGAFRREPGRDYEPMRRGISAPGPPKRPPPQEQTTLF